MVSDEVHRGTCQVLQSRSQLRYRAFRFPIIRAIIFDRDVDNLFSEISLEWLSPWHVGPPSDFRHQFPAITTRCRHC